MTWSRPLTMPRTLPPILSVLPDSSRYTITVRYLDDRGAIKTWTVKHEDSYETAELIAHDPELWDWPADWDLAERLSSVELTITRTSVHVYRTGRSVHEANGR